MDKQIQISELSNLMFDYLRVTHLHFQLIAT